jgi:hypothetical protein
MVLLTDYRGFLIDVRAVAADAGWDAEIRIRPTISQTKPRVENLKCGERSARLAEERGALHAQRWVDRIADWDRGHSAVATTVPQPVSASSIIGNLRSTQAL